MSVVLGAERASLLEHVRYGKGCLSLEEDCTPALTELLQSRKEESCGKLGAGIFTKRTGSIMLKMSDVKNQRFVGSCSAFTLIACCEYLFPNLKFSEAELYMRAKTSKFSRREKDGSSLFSYLQILEEGLVEEKYFLPYEVYNIYVQDRTKLKEAHDIGKTMPVSRFYTMLLTRAVRNRPPVYGDFCTHSMLADYAESIQEFKDWAFKKQSEFGEMPPIIKPCWRVEKSWGACTGLTTAQLDRSQDIVLVQEGINAATGRLVTPAIILPASQEYLGKNAYFIGFKTHMLMPKCIDDLKRILAEGFPVAISIDTFVKYEIVPDEEGDPKKVKTLDFWQDAGYLAGVGYRLDMAPKSNLPTGIEADGAHAICLCGYDDAIGAFRFKNSWGSDWADKGYAWISYDYIINHSIEYGAVYVTKK